jgi:hypothetical protein
VIWEEGNGTGILVKNSFCQYGMEKLDFLVLLLSLESDVMTYLHGFKKAN